MSRIEIRDVRPEIKRLSLLLLFFLFLFFPCFAENDIAIVVNGDNIYKDDYDYALARYEDSYKRYIGEDIDGSVREKVKNELIDDLINRQLYLEEAKRRGITAKAFAGEEEIEETLMSEGLSSQESKSARDRAEKVVLAYKMREILPPKVIAALREEVTASSKDVLDEYLKRAEKMRVKYIKIDPVALANNMEISVDEMRDYYKYHLDKFRCPEVKEYAALYFDPYDYVDMAIVTPQMLKEYYNGHINEFKSNKLAKVKYVLFRTKDYLSQVYELGVNLEQYYEDNLDKFIEPAEARIRFISLKKTSDKKKLQALENELSEGVPFPELAKKYSDDASSALRGGDLGYIREGTLKEPLDGIAFGLKSGQASGIIETDKSYCVLYVEEKKEWHVQSFEDVKDKIEEQLLNEAARPLAMADAKRFKNEARKIGFEKAAAKKGSTFFETDYFASSDRIPMIGRNLLFAITAMELVSGEVSNEIDYDEGYAVMEGMDVKMPEILPFSEISGSIEKRLISEASVAYAESAAKHALDLISEGVPLKELENRMSVHVTTAEALSAVGETKDVGAIIKKSDGYYVTVLATEEPSYLPTFDQISEEVASTAVLARADKLAEEQAMQLLLSGVITSEQTAKTGAFSINDYVLERENMRPFIEQSFMLKAGQTGIVKNFGKYYVVQVIERGAKLAGYEDESAVIRSQVLKEKKSEYADNWLKKERDKAQVQVNL